ncbi:unnamed protein product [Cunninghamella blakesleeana]
MCKRNSCKINLHENDLCNHSFLPNEIITKIYHHLPTEDLLQLYSFNSSSSPLSYLASQEVLKRFERCEIGLRLYFDQESKWRYAIDFKLLKQENHTLVFIPIAKPSSMYFYTSKMLRRPMLYKVSFISSSKQTKDGNGGVNDVFKNTPDNLLSKSHPIDIKQLGQFHTMVHHQDLSLLYTIHETPSHLIKKRSGERVFCLHAFQCHLDWLCQTKSFLNKWVDLLHNKPQPRPMSSHQLTKNHPIQSQIGQVAEIDTLLHPMLINHRHHHKSPIGSLTLVPNLLGH